MIGRIVGNYKIESKIGEGGMGAVYKGVDTMLDREVAIKALRPELASQTTVVERFRSEAVTLAKLHHPNIATLYSLFRQGEELYMVLEFVRGATLEEVLQRHGALAAERVIPMFCQILDGIDHAHEFGVVHRDIKPANMMLTEKGTLKVLDFGIARLLGTNRMTRAGNIIGTLEYMAPEQVKGLETDARTDIYALGMMLYEVLTGRAPFESENEFELMKLQTEATPVRPRALNASIPTEVEEAIIRAIQKNPDERFQTAGDFRESLLDAGYAAQSEIHRSTTGSRQSQSNTFSASQFVSKPDAPPVPTTPPDIAETRRGVPDSGSSEPKETRLGAPTLGAPESGSYEAKETRLGAVAAAPFAATFSEPSPSFFDNLNWVHYAGAGAGAMVAVVMAVIVSVFAFSSSSEPERPVIQATPAPTAGTQARQPAPTATPSPVVQTAAAPTPAPVETVPIAEPTVVQTPETPSDTSKTTAKAKSTPRPPAPAPTRKPVVKPSARCLLTGQGCPPGWKG